MRTKPNRLALGVAAALFAASLAGTGPADAASDAALYRQADANGNGKLNAQEFRTFIRALAKNGNRLARTVRMFGAYGMAFRMTDKNKDGELTGAELRRSARENADRAN